MTIRKRTTGAVAGLAATAALAGVLLAGGNPASAATAPPWEPDPQSVGTITFYDSSGSVITSGPTDTAPFAAYAVGSVYPRSGDTFAVTDFANPLPSTTTDNFYVEQSGLFTQEPLTTGPANIRTLSQTKPVVEGGEFDQTLDGFESDSQISTDPAYQNIVQIRIQTANSGSQITQTYDVADVKIDPSTHTWTQIYPEPPAVTSTSTTLTADPNPATAGQSVTLTAQETPATAGSVQFKDGSTDLGAPVAVDGSGKAMTSATFGAGSHDLSAVFTPGSSGFTGSTGSTTLTVDPVATTTKPSVTAVAPASGPTIGGTTVTITGSHFTGADRVVFRTTRVTSFTVVSDTQITVTTPAHDKGTVQVRVHNPGGLSAKNPSARFTYVTPDN